MKYFFLEGHMSDLVTILIGHNRKLVGHDSTYWPASWRLEQPFWFEKIWLSTPKKPLPTHMLKLTNG